MIAKNSKSYPYLAIAQHYEVSYAEVLATSDLFSRFMLSPPYTEWRYMVWAIERDKRKQ